MTTSTKKIIRTLVFASTLLTVCLIGCEKFELPEEAYEDINQVENLNTWVVDPEFSYRTDEDLRVQLKVVDNAGNALKKVPLKISAMMDENASQKVLASGMSDEYGQLITELRLDLNIQYLVVDINYPGFPSGQIIPLTGNDITYLIDPRAEPTTLNVVPEDKSRPLDQKSAAALTFNYMGTYNNQGKPDYLEPVDQVISQEILDVIAASLPEGQPVPQFNPQYISSGNAANIVLDSDAEMWITFIHEGAGYRNSVGYYAYPSSNPPTSTNDISDLKVIFPNVSFQGSGGQLQTGNQVYLGSFSAGTTVGWFLIPNGWDSSAGEVVDDGAQNAKFSNTNLNDFTDASYRSHCVVLEDSNNESLYLGFEDIDRPAGDNDFNDAIFHITANPFSAINVADLPQVQTTLQDTDNDGAPDNSDSFVDDPDIAFVSNVPGENVFGTLVYEDMWPSTGDYDMNDMVIDYNFTEYRNASNRVIKTRAKFILKAMGAGLENGFGFETNLSPDQIESATGSQITANRVSLNSNGCEANQDNAVIIVFDNGYDIMYNAGGFVNTDETDSYIQPDTITIDITYSNPIPAGQIGSAPYNPFIFTGRGRGYEVHLPDNPGTSLADVSLYQTESDNSNPTQGRYYKTFNNMPWALNFPNGFDYPIEKTNLQKAYKHFQKWVLSSGNEYPDWYFNKAGYRDTQFIY